MKAPLKVALVVAVALCCTSAGESAAKAPPLCRADQLTASDLGAKAAGTRRVTTVELVNNSPQRCSLHGYPEVSFKRLSGSPFVATLNPTPHDQQYRTPPPATLTLGSVDRARFYLGYTALDAQGNSCTPISTIVIGGFANHSSLSLPDTIGPCDTLNVSPYFKNATASAKSR